MGPTRSRSVRESLGTQARSYLTLLLVACLILFGSGCTRVDTRLLAVFSVSSLEGHAPLTVEFDSSYSLVGEDGLIVSYSWDFGDGTHEAYLVDETPLGRVSHTYVSPGIYLATLTVTDERGRKDAATAKITVHGFTPSARIAEMPEPGKPTER